MFAYLPCFHRSGSGFGQKDNTFHFRITILPPEDQVDSVISSISKFHTKFLAEFR